MNADTEAARLILYKYAKQNPNGKLGAFLKGYHCQVTGQALSQSQQAALSEEVGRRIEAERFAADEEIEDTTSISNPEKHVDWYPEWRENNPESDRRWKLLKDFLRDKFSENRPLNQAEISLRTVDEASDDVLILMENPAGTSAFQSKGLVVGYVQSGKTANFTAVIAKAVDAGYKLIIVLTGIHELLRRQTQDRLDAELTGMTSKVDMPRVNLHQHGLVEWSRLTTFAQDFAPAPHPHFEQVVQKPGPILAVIKKNCFVLKKIHDWAKSAPESLRKRVPILIIDDEADQASIDTKFDRDALTANDDPSKTNACIRRILGLFDRHAYIGYTATPFAIMLISATTDEADLNRDLYPRNFITALPKPAEFLSYMGAAHIFKSGLDKHLVKLVPAKEVSALTGSGRTAATRPTGPTPNLIEAIQSFLLSAAARRQRGDVLEPASMLIHTSQRQMSHGKMKVVVDSIVSNLKTQLQDPNERKILHAKLKALWDRDFIPAARAMRGNHKPVAYSDIRPKIDEVLEKVDTLELNHQSEDRLDYKKHPGQVVIAIGGNQLSRGLTIEGLLVSLYLRRSTQYDTLLQMGRWFGYRPNYEDLVRIYTTKELAGWFEHLSLVEEEIRKEIARYRDEGLTPMDFAPRIRDHADMRITAPNKMGAGNDIGGFGRSTTSTFWLPLDKVDILRKNLKLGTTFVGNIHQLRGFERRKGLGGYLAKDIDGLEVLRFLQEYRFALPHEMGGGGLDSVRLLEYIERLIKSGELQRWNVGLASLEKKPDTPKGAVMSVGELEIVKVTRNRRLEGSKGYRVGSMTNQATIRLDRKSVDEKLFSRGIPSKPLLVLYFVDKDSEPRRDPAKKGKKPVNPEVKLFKDIPASERCDVLGLGFVFPESIVDGDGFVGQRVNED